MHRGYVKIHRKSVDNPLYKKPLIWHFWMYCLIRANHEESILPFNNKPITIKRGSFIMSLNHAVDDTGLSKQNIRTAIKALVNFKMIEKSTQELTQQATMINICNYSLYQKKKKEANTVSNTLPTQSQHSANTQPTLDNEPLNTIKNVKNKKTYVENSDELRLANFLYQNILKNKPDFKEPNLQKWADDAEKMIRIDKRNVETSKRLIDWVQKDNFEQSNVLSIEKLRKRFDSLEIKMNNPQQSKFEKKPVPTSKEIIAGMEINLGEAPKQIWNMEPEIKLINQG